MEPAGFGSSSVAPAVDPYMQNPHAAAIPASCFDLII
jgi:hypothetical protein